MVYPQSVDRGEGFKIWRIVVNILNKQLETADKEWSSGLGIGKGANYFPIIKHRMFQNVTKVLQLGLIL
jgi:hypothetical protein